MSTFLLEIGATKPSRRTRASNTLAASCKPKSQYSATVISLKEDLRASRTAQEKSDMALRASNAALDDMNSTCVS